jgi:hypothetical protein
MNAEQQRLTEDAKREKNWKRWGAYLSERQWGTVREDYSEGGNCWDYFPHDQARSRAYRWGEDGLLGITDRECRLCFALALWNGKDPILKERLFGLTGPEGNHGEDVKECYYYLDSTPTHSYMKALYKYPQAEFPYARLVEENRRRGKLDPELELIDTGVFDDNRYFDVVAEYAKAGPDDILIKITVANRGPEKATLHLLPTLWYRNTWIWGCKHEGCWIKPRFELQKDGTVTGEHVSFGKHHFVAGVASAVPSRQVKDEHAPSRLRTADATTAPEFLFTENETNSRKLYDTDNWTPYVKDAFHEYVIHGQTGAVNPKKVGTKVAAHYRLEVPADGEVVVRLRLANEKTVVGKEFETIFQQRLREADEFYNDRLPASLAAEERSVVRQAYAGLLWSKQFYHYIVRDWLDGDPQQPAPPAARTNGRNADWAQLYNRDIISMPDKWEYPWYAAWDLAFHMIPFAKIDPQFAKDQLVLFLREWYMHPNGQLPAYEFAFGDVNPPVHAWACWRVYKMTAPTGQRDRMFLSRTFQKLLLNFTWWVNRKDTEGKNLFSGGFLGLDNIGVFDRSRPLPTGGHLEQADGTAWMAFFCNTMLSMALELAQTNPATEDMASKFFEHFVAIADAINTLGGTGLWDEQDGFYYDQLHVDGRSVPLRIRSLVGLMPLIACEILEEDAIEKLPGFKKRLQWFLEHRQDLAQHISYMVDDNSGRQHGHRLLAIPSRERLERVLKYMLDENEFLSPYGIRSVSKYHEIHPYVFSVNGDEHRVDYVPAEGNSGLFGGNSNWRGPIWFPINYLLVEALERYHHFYGDTLKVECPTGSGRMLNLQQVADDLRSRLARIFLPDETGRRPCHGDERRYAEDPHWKDLALFYEYFHGDTGRGVGASHQTGWTALVTRCIENAAHRRLASQNGVVIPSEHAHPSVQAALTERA